MTQFWHCLDASKGSKFSPWPVPPSKDGAFGRVWHSPQAWHCPGATPEPGTPRKTRDKPLGSGTAQQRGFSTESSKTLAQRGAAAPSLEAFSASDVPRSRLAQGKAGVLATEAGAAAWLAPALARPSLMVQSCQELPTHRRARGRPWALPAPAASRQQ